MSEALDPRLHALRPDLADKCLEGRVTAARFADGAAATVVVGHASLKETPGIMGRQGSELLFGERVQVFERADGWAWVQNETDGYVGYLSEKALGPAVGTPTHVVTALRSYLFPEPDLKTVPLDVLHLTSAVHAVDRDGDWTGIETAGMSGWLWSAHLGEVGSWESDPVEVARRFTGAPYGWGGRSTEGLDCSALVQLALARCGIACQRDSDMQEATLGSVVEGVEQAEYGDVLFWPSHEAFYLGDGTILHANAHHMAVAEEPLADFRARTVARIGDVRTVRRPDRP